MRLLDVHGLQVVDVPDDAIPEYAVLSHTWGLEEVTFQDLQGLEDGWLNSGSLKSRKVMNKRGFSKAREAAKLASQDGYNYLWADTCCIDKTSSAELSEAINSMYLWYEQATVCYAYLSDVVPVAEENPLVGEDAELDGTSFRRSRWFTRGWTLQELLAPKDVRFYAQDWSFIGNKKGNIKLQNLLSRITGIDGRVLDGLLKPQDLSVSTRMKWASMRQTTRPEDIAYCLMGLFGVNMPLLYGEGKRAFLRLQEEILKETDDQSLFAWTYRKSKGQTWASLYGLLAESPLHFKDVWNIRPLPPLTTRDSVPSSITNQGLHVQLYLVEIITRDQASSEEEYPAENYRAILDCSVMDENFEYCPTIYLRRLWGDQFARVLPSESELLPPPLEIVNTGSEGYQKVYIKQRPVYHMPAFTLMDRERRLPNAIVNGRSFFLEGVYPSDRWDFNSLSLKSVYSQFDRVMGVFRFHDKYTPGLKVDVAVGLRRVRQKRWESWCSQRRSHGDSLDLVFQSFEQTLKQCIHDSSIPHQRLGEHLSLGRGEMIPSQASVTETRAHGRSYIFLQFIPKPEIDTSKELQVMPSCPIPRWFEVEATDKFEQELRELTSPCSVEDTANLSVFQTTNLTTRVRRVRQTVPTGSSFSDSLEQVLSSLDLSQLTIRDPSSRKLSSSERALSMALLYACKEGDFAQLEDLFKRNAVVEVETENFHSFRPLHWAAIGGHYYVVRFLLSVGAQDFSVTSQGWTAVHIAAMMGHIDILRLFLEKAEHVDLSGSDILEARTTGALESPLHVAAAYMLPDAFDRFINTLFSQIRDLNLRVRNYLGETPLHRAAAANNARALLGYLQTKRVVRTGLVNDVVTVDFHTVDDFSRSPVWHAACAGSSDSVIALADDGANLDLADKTGRSPLHAACMEGRTDAVRSLLEFGANPNIVTSPPGLRPCHYAALFGHQDCLRLLIQHNAKADAPTLKSAYFKPIHLAAANGWLECVRILYAATSDPGGYSSHYMVLGEDGAAILVARPTESTEQIARLQGHENILKFFEGEKAESEPVKLTRYDTYSTAGPDVNGVELLG